MRAEVPFVKSITGSGNFTVYQQDQLEKFIAAILPHRKFRIFKNNLCYYF